MYSLLVTEKHIICGTYENLIHVSSLLTAYSINLAPLLYCTRIDRVFMALKSETEEIQCHTISYGCGHKSQLTKKSRATWCQYAHARLTLVHGQELID